MKIEEITLITCPQCRSQYNTTITPIIDVSDEPALKTAFLTGNLNTGQCPTCGFSGELELPLIYHDKEKELALIFSPNNLQLSHTEAQRIIGDLSNRLINALAPEDRKSYLFTPKPFLTLESLKKAVLEADGITEEMLQAQAAKMDLLQQMLNTSNPDELKKLVESHDADLDRQFFEILSGSAFNALANGNQQQGQALLGFRQMVAEWSSRGQEIVAEIDEAAGFQKMTPETLLESLKNASDEQELINIIRAGKPLMDYTFFQTLTGQIETLEATGQPQEAEKLKILRAHILDISARLEDEGRKIINQANQLLQEVLQASNLENFVSENLDRFDDTFFSVLAANAQGAAKQGQQKVAEQLAELQKRILTIIQEKVPPEFQLLNLLLVAESLEAIKTILAENRSLITAQFMDMLAEVKQDFAQQGQTQIVNRLDQIKQAADELRQGGIILTP